MGSDNVVFCVHGIHVVSIHAPTWGATLARSARSPGEAVSIHAPTWGATLKTISLAYSSMFQSTLPHGERQMSAARPSVLCSFNPRSHMGSDSRHSCGEQTLKSFNPRSHMGSDVLVFVYRQHWRCFNPRSHMGSDLHLLGFVSLCHRFNPRSHMGSDRCDPEDRQKGTVSIHAPTWGATSVVGPAKVVAGFNPRSHMGSDKLFFEYEK